jgi:acyl-CoA synthetase (AMP-forming)/AMP-acid ligase II
MNVGDWIRKRGQISCDETTVIFEDNRREGKPTYRFTYKELNEQVNRLANALLEKGIRKGDRIPKGKLAKYKIPEQVEFTDEFPKTASGKIKKADLKKRYARPRK